MLDIKSLKVDDKVTLSCSVEVFEENVAFGVDILKENFSDDLVATITSITGCDYLSLGEVVEGSGEASLYGSEVKYLKLVEDTPAKQTQPKIVQLFSHNYNLLGLGDDGVVYSRVGTGCWEVYYPATFKE